MTPRNLLVRRDPCPSCKRSRRHCDKARWLWGAGCCSACTPKILGIRTPRPVGDAASWPTTSPSSGPADHHTTDKETP